MHTMPTMTLLATTLAPTITGNTVTTTTVTTTTTTTIESEPWNEHCRLSPGAGAGIGIASLLIICATTVVLVWLCCSGRNLRRSRSNGCVEHRELSGLEGGRGRSEDGKKWF